MLHASMPNEDRQQRFWGWPGIKNLAYAYFVLGPLLMGCFILVYAGADGLTGLHHYRVPLFFEWELSIPFVPATVLFYNSLHVAYSIAPFILRTRGEMNAMALVWVLITLLAGIGFLVVPFEAGFPRPADDSLGPWRAMYHFADDANLTFNCFPSLHVAWSIACLDVYSRKAGRFGKPFLAAWGAAIMLSTLLTHFHHVADVAGGFLLAMFGSRLLYPWLLSLNVTPRGVRDVVAG
ncbi:MAG: phosphatase PAP2 family protein [Candidatus Saccharimonadales bacterium]